MAEEQQYIVAGTSSEDNVVMENCLDFTMEESQLLPVFKKSHISTRAIEQFLVTGEITDYSEDANKRNALRQATQFYRMVNRELYRYGTDREYKKYGLRIVVHDDEPQKKLDILVKCHVDDEGNHFGMNNTIKRVNNLYYWQGVSAHVKIFLKKCRICKGRSKYEADTWIEEERKMLARKREKLTVCNEAKNELKNLGRIKRPTPPETFFIVNAEKKVDLESGPEVTEMLIDSNNIEYVVETLGYSEDGVDLPEVCHVFNVPDIVPVPSRFRSREIEIFLKEGVYPEDFTSNMKAGLRGPAAQYAIIEDELYHEGNKKGSKGQRLVIHDDNPALKVKVMVENHLDEDGTHLGLNRTMCKISEKYFWVGLSLDVRKFMMNCKVCLLTRGKKSIDCDARFEGEVEKLKKRQKMQHGEKELVEENYTEMEIAEGGADKDNVSLEIIRLVGPNQDVTEITVAVANQDGKPAAITEEQIAALTSANAETQCATDSIVTHTPPEPEQIEAKIEQKVEIDEESVAKPMDEPNEGTTSTETDIPPETEVVEKTVEEATAEETSVVEAALGMIMASEKASLNEISGENVDPENKSDETQVQEIGISEDDGDKSSDEKLPEPAANPTSKTGLFWYHKDIIYVPKSAKTRAIELFLHGNIVTSGYTTTQLEEATKNFFLEEDALYRRASRYKRRQFVIHDDNPEAKLNIIEQCHVKANGRHFSEVLTVQNISYKYYWEEAKWDVHRFYIRCQKCVKDGEDVRLKKKVLTVEEQKLQTQQLRRQSCETGLSAKRNREYRDRYKDRLEKFKLWNKYGKDEGDMWANSEFVEADAVTLEQDEDLQGVNLDGTTLQEPHNPESVEYSVDQDESDIEINMPESEDEEEEDTGTNKTSVKRVVVEETDDSEVYTLVVYATLDQVNTLRQMFKKNNWDLKVDKITKYLDGNSEGSDGQKDKAIYEVEIPVRKEQEQAVHELFAEKKWSYTYEELKPTGTTTPVKTVVNGPTKAVKTSKNQVTTPGRPNTRQKTETKTSPQKKVVTEKTAQKEEETPKGKKRGFEAIETPVTEGRRSSRREIKMPRRFGPDFEVDTPKFRTSVESPKSSVQIQKLVINTPKSEPGKLKTAQTKPQTPKKQDIVKSEDVKPAETRSTRTRQSAKLSTAEETTLKPPEKVPNETKIKTLPEKQGVKIFSSSDLVVVQETVNNLEDESVEHCPTKATDSETEKLDNKHSIGKSTIKTENSSQVLEDDGDHDDDLAEMDLQDDDEDIRDEEDLDEEEGLDDDNMDDKNEKFDDDDDYMDDDEEEFDDDDDDVDEVDEEEAKALAIFTDPTLPSNLVEIKKFLEKGMIDMCVTCGKVFKKTQIKELTQHLAQHETSDLYPCESCSKVFTDSKCALVHKRVHRAEKSEQCSVCEAQFHTSYMLAAHLYKEHGECTMYRCDICDAKFVSMKFMKVELMCDGELSFFKCVMCPK